MRSCGVLLPIASLPSRFGIGSFSKEAYEFVDQLVRAGQKKWQILPLGATGYGDSPYQSFSTFAGNPYYIDLEGLMQEGLLIEDECRACDFGNNIQYIDYEKIYNSRFVILRKAFSRFRVTAEFEAFVEENKSWLEDYCLYMAIKNANGGSCWITWEKPLRNREPEALKKAQQELAEEMQFYRFQQYFFQKQWKKLKKYANDRGIQIIGDIPIYVAFDSSDTWADPQLFQFDENQKPKAVAGCPPDGFSPTGQLWGNPLYNWEYHKKTGYAWWIRRMSYSLTLYDIVRVDHFRGFEAYYAIPYGDKTAEHGHWEKGPGMDLFSTLHRELGEMNIIAEDLGFLTDSVRQLLKDTEYPGMKVIQFAFDSREESDYLPHIYPKNCVVYTGTHDNQTTRAWYREMNEHDRNFANEYMGSRGGNDEEKVWDFIRLALASVADLAIIPIQDYLCLGAEARINQPSTLGDNWKWRLRPGQIEERTLEKMRRMAQIYGRL